MASGITRSWCATHVCAYAQRCASRMGVIGEDFWQRWFPTSVIESALPKLGEAGFNWQRPIGQWPREDMVRFLREALYIIQNEMIKRDKITPFDDEIPFALVAAFLVPFAIVVTSHVI